MYIGGFSKDIERRYADMEILIREFNENSTDDRTEGINGSSGDQQRARLAIQRLNAIHNQYGHYVYTN